MNEAGPTMRLHLHVPTAVQGELFPACDAQLVTRGYKGSVASRVSGITYRQLDYWARRQIVEPSITPSHGSGSRRLYSFKDVLILAVSKKLLDACDGQHVHECTDSEQMMALLQSGRAVFGVSMGSLWKQIRDALEHEEYVDLSTMPSTADSTRPVDDIAAMRMKKKLDAKRQAHTAVSL